MSAGHTVELRVNNDLLPHFEAALPHLAGHEVARREDPTDPRTTIVDMAMDDAPKTAATMHLTLERHRNRGVHIRHITYQDAEGQELAIIAPPDDDGWFEPARP